MRNQYYRECKMNILYVKRICNYRRNTLEILRILWMYKIKWRKSLKQLRRWGKLLLIRKWQLNQVIIIYKLVLNEAMESLSHIEKANKNLIDATKMNEDFGRRWSLLFMGMAFFLLFYDFINCWYNGSLLA